jgi:hypothetical protein
LRITTLALVASCHSTTAVTWYGGGTVTLTLTPVDADGISVTAAVAGAADLPVPRGTCASSVAVSDDPYLAALDLCAAGLAPTAVGDGLCLETVDLELTMDNTDVHLAVAGADHADEGMPADDRYPFPFPTTGSYEGVFALASACPGDRATHDHALVATWDLDRDVSRTREYEHDGGGIPGVGD